jgi:hypothetical protein
MSHSRRRLLAALAATGAGSVAGCLGRIGGALDDGSETPTDDTEEGSETPTGGGEASEAKVQVDLGVPCGETDGPIDLSGGRPPTEIDGAQATPETSYGDEEIPLREKSLYLGHDRETFVESHLSGGVGHDGIPSIDEPRFARADEVEMPACERVFGVEIDGDVRAYPQRILVRHEIVNDVVGGEPVAVTYCPLTGTTQGFYRGGVEFGVSGRLVNSNLIMYDRAFDVRWPQVAATAIEVGGEARTDGGDRLIGRSLHEFRVVWTTWERWSEKHPDTLVMTSETGFARSYNRDPYGSYTPVSGHYAIDTSRQPSFPLITTADDDEKRVVIGARTTDGAVAFDKRALLEESVLSGAIGDTPVVAVADDELATGYVYANPDGLDVTPTEEGYTVDEETAVPDELPLESIIAFEAMWFAWFGYYPDTGRVGL